MKIPEENVPVAARVTALSVYRWDDEAGKDIEIYGYGNTGRADKFVTVSE